MLRIVFVFRKDCLKTIEKHFTNPSRADIKCYPQNLSDFKYRYLYVVECGDSSMTFGLVFNGTNKNDNYKGFVEFNPNKTMSSMVCYSELKFMLSNSVYFDVSRWDLAIDMPYKRNEVILRRDRRMYETTQKSREDYTEYLGQRNCKGRVKLYNKTKESKLDYDDTRLEITLGGLDNALSDFQNAAPVVSLRQKQLKMNLDPELSDTQKVLIGLLQITEDADYWLNQLQYRIRKKIEPYVYPENAQLSFDSSCVLNIVSEIKRLINVRPAVTNDSDFIELLKEIELNKKRIAEYESDQNEEIERWLNG